MESAELIAVLREVRDRVRARNPETAAGAPSGPEAMGIPLPDLLPLVHARDSALGKVAAIGTVNPRPGGLVNWLVQTWKRLARRGLWVQGCAESLGEHEPQNIETLAGSSLKWLKLTHTSGYEGGGMQRLATYRLVPKNGKVNLKGKTYFFWQSGSSFEHAL